MVIWSVPCGHSVFSAAWTHVTAVFVCRLRARHYSTLSWTRWQLLAVQMLQTGARFSTPHPPKFHTESTKTCSQGDDGVCSCFTETFCKTIADVPAFAYPPQSFIWLSLRQICRIFWLLSSSICDIYLTKALSRLSTGDCLQFNVN